MPDTSSPDSDAQLGNKRKASAAGIGARPQRTAKRRASKACQCCRARKVRCNVVEHGAPCTNCRLDEVECIVTESKRKRKSWSNLDNEPDFLQRSTAAFANRQKTVRSNSAHSDITTIEPANIAFDFGNDEHVPHTLYQTHGCRLSLPPAATKPAITFPGRPQLPVFGHDADLMDNRPNFYQNWVLPSPITNQLPAFIKPIPSRIGIEEASYLQSKNVLAVPDVSLRNELLRSYIEYVHPYMPLLDLNDFLETIEQGDAGSGKISLLLFQAVMFSASAFVDIAHLRMAGFASRREARKVLYRKARLLYDFDYEVDRVVIVQSLLLMTFWYETPDDQKDTFHWMGVATSVAYAVGLHRDPANSSMEPKRQRLWKRIWWSCYMRDRLICLGMRRPCRIKAEDSDVPMLELEDFEIQALPSSITCVPRDCKLARDVSKQRALATMCIEKIKLCQCIGHILTTQYSISNQHMGSKTNEGVVFTSTLLVPKQGEPESQDVRTCHEELSTWSENLPEEAKLDATAALPDGPEYLVVAKGLLHMLYYATLGALHRPHVLPSTWHTAAAPGEALDLSRSSVRLAAKAITHIATNFQSRNLVRYLPTTGVTALLPAIIAHLLDIKSSSEATRNSSLQGFCQCMQVLSALRDIYASADFCMGFLEAAVRQANIRVPNWASENDQALTNASLAELTTLTPPASDTELDAADGATAPPSTASDEADADITLTTRLEAFLACTPPGSGASDDPDFDSYHHPYHQHRPAYAIAHHDFDAEFGALVDFDGMHDSGAVAAAAAAAAGFEDGLVGGATGFQGESSGFTTEMDFMRGDGLAAVKSKSKSKSKADGGSKFGVAEKNGVHLDEGDWKAMLV